MRVFSEGQKKKCVSLVTLSEPAPFAPNFLCLVFFMEKYFLILVNPNQIWIVVTLFSIDLALNGISFGARSMGIL